MKNGTTEHPKMFELARRLEIPHGWAVGIMEMLWHFAVKYARRGDVGRWSDEAIAEAVRWPHEVPRLIDALVDVGWLERCTIHRLVIHDWHEHANDTVKKYLKAKGETFAVAQVSGTSANVAPLPASVTELPEADVPRSTPAERLRKVPESSRLPMPLPKPIPTHTLPTVSVESTSTGPPTPAAVGGVVMEFWRRMPEAARASPSAIAAAAGKPLPSDCARAAELVSRWGVDELTAVLPKVVQAVTRKFPAIKAFGGAVAYFEAELGKVVQAGERKRQREDAAAKRRRESESAEAARARRQALWRNLPEEERQRWRNEVKGSLPLFYDQHADQKADLVEVMAIAKYEEAIQ